MVTNLDIRVPVADDTLTDVDMDALLRAAAAGALAAINAYVEESR